MDGEAVRRIPEPQRPMSTEREYLRFLNSYARTYARVVRIALSEIVPDLRDTSAQEQPRFDENIEERIARALDYAHYHLDKVFPTLILVRWARQMIAGVNKNSKRQFGRQIKSAFKREEEPKTLDPFMDDRKLSPYFQNIVDENVGLIRSITTMGLPALKNELVALITADAPSADIAKALQKHLSPQGRGGAQVNVFARAELIARDQVGKLNGALEEYRQKNLGLKRYRWRTSEDSRVRPDHDRLEGQIFDWSNPPIVDRRTGRRAHPKRDFQCRCWAEPILDDIMGAA
jgi:SPP1 gp7 family putative phage head morphogenesis protein